MSVFKNIKGTIQSVQQDISTSIKSLTTSTKDRDVTRKQDLRKRNISESHRVNLEAGAELLNKYQENWSELHNQAEENATKAENVAILIGSLFVTYDRQAKNFSRLTEEVKGFPNIIQQLQDLTSHIAQVEELCEQVEAAEIQLENICEVQEYRKAENDHHRQLALYKEKKMAAVEKYKVELAQQHARKMKALENKRQAQLKERQSIFQEAFDKDINYYRTFGHTERQPSVDSETAAKNLADFKIEEDPDELNSFLESTDVTPSVEARPVVTEDDTLDDESDSGVINDSSELPEPVTAGLQATQDQPSSIATLKADLSADNGSSNATTDVNIPSQNNENFSNGASEKVETKASDERKDTALNSSTENGAKQDTECDVPGDVNSRSLSKEIAEAESLPVSPSEGDTSDSGDGSHDILKENGGVES